MHQLRFLGDELNGSSLPSKSSKENQEEEEGLRVKCLSGWSDKVNKHPDLTCLPQKDQRNQGSAGCRFCPAMIQPDIK